MIYGLFFGFCVIAYLCGSVNFAIITTKAFTGGDVRSSGSGNAGMTNVMRTAGFLPGLITFFGDYVKAVAAVALGKYILPDLAKLWIPDLSAEILAILPIYGALFAGFFCLLGHMFPVFYGFRGGKGIVTAAGTMVVLDWRLFLIELGVFAVLFLITRIISVGSIFAAICYPLTAWICFFVMNPIEEVNRLAALAEVAVNAKLFIPIATGCAALLVVYKHKDNIRRLFKGEEKQLKLKKNK